ncbi:MAG: hypothetical protein FJ011_26300 [Chloroflexi bacterium]|nr:hypothetical protein [Chloroflexota bacterium]
MPTTHETKAARLLAFYRLEADGQLTGVSDIELARALGVRRETIWRDRQAMARAAAMYENCLARLQRMQSEIKRLRQAEPTVYRPAGERWYGPAGELGDAGVSATRLALATGDETG